MGGGREEGRGGSFSLDEGRGGGCLSRVGGGIGCGHGCRCERGEGGCR